MEHGRNTDWLAPIGVTVATLAMAAAALTSPIDTEKTPYQYNPDGETAHQKTYRWADNPDTTDPYDTIRQLESTTTYRCLGSKVEITVDYKNNQPDDVSTAASNACEDDGKITYPEIPVGTL